MMTNSQTQSTTDIKQKESKMTYLISMVITKIRIIKGPEETEVTPVP